MTMLAEKLKSAGVDTIGAKLTAAVTDGLRHHPDSVVDAWRYAGAVFGHEFARELMRDMKGAAIGNEQKSPLSPLQKDNHSIASKPYTPRVISKETIERRRKLQEAIRSKYKNSGGISWSEVTWHELTALARDGKEATALYKAGPANIPNDGRTVGDVLGAKRIDEIIGELRKASA